ncbi:MAG: hypothetical protein QQN46_02005 [Nitrosopumilus sp.]
MTDPHERRVVLLKGKTKVHFIWYTDDKDSVVVQFHSIWKNGKPGTAKRTLERNKARKLWRRLIEQDGYKKL